MGESKQTRPLDPADPEVELWWDEREREWQEHQFQEWIAQQNLSDCEETRRLWRQNGWRQV